MPDTISIGLCGLCGGSLVKFHEEGTCTVGPTNLGDKLLKEAQCFGGSVLTTSDIAVSSHTRFAGAV